VFLLCDDINPGKPREANRISVKDVKQYLELGQSDRNYEVLKCTSVAWVVGSLAEGDSIEKWLDFVENIGIAREFICVIDLNSTVN